MDNNDILAWFEFGDMDYAAITGSSQPIRS